MSLYEHLKSALFRLDAETAHNLAMKAIPLMAPVLGRCCPVNNEGLGVDLDGLGFNNPVGLAAGFDKSARVTRSLAAFGFGFVEVGTVTPLPQSGHPRPRLFRFPEKQALVNRMGFNNDGAEIVARRLEKSRPAIPVGVNLGKNKDPPNDKALEDYMKGYRTFSELADYLVVNVSSPNTPGLRDLQDKSALLEIFAALNEANAGKEIPIWLKLAPDLSDQALEEIVEVVEERAIYGLIATNTTIDHSALKLVQQKSGGLSGVPLSQASDRVLQFMAERLRGKCRLMGVGGVSDSARLIRKISLGADLVQIYTGWIYGGPGFVRSLLKGLKAHLQQTGMSLDELRFSGLGV